MTFKIWPTNVKRIYKIRYDKRTGKKIKKVENVEVDCIHCPKCFKNLEYTEFGDRYNGLYCFHCGRDLRKPFTKTEIIRYWIRWMGDWKLLGQWPIGYLYDKSSKKRN